MNRMPILPIALACALFAYASAPPQSHAASEAQTPGLWISDWPYAQTPHDAEIMEDVITSGMRPDQVSQIILTAADSASSVSPQYPPPQLARYLRSALRQMIWVYDGTSVNNSAAIAAKTRYVSAQFLSETPRMRPLKLIPTPDRLQYELRRRPFQHGSVYVNVLDPKTGNTDTGKLHLTSRVSRKRQAALTSTSSEANDLNRAPQPIYDPMRPIDIVRTPHKQERWYSLVNDGDMAMFTVYSYGRPTQGIPVTLQTEEGWQRTVTSDGDGRVRFTLPERDIAPPWGYSRNWWQHALITTSHMASDGATHRITLSTKLYPSRESYFHRFSGILVTGLTVVLVLAGLWLHGRYAPNRYHKVDF